MTSGGTQLLVYRTDLSHGGADRVALTLVRELRRRGISVEVAVMRRFGPWLEEVESLVPVHDLARTSLLRVPWPLARLLRRLRPNAFLCLDGGGNVPAVLAHRLAGSGARLVLSERNILLIGGETSKRKLQVALKRLLYPLADRITAVSEGVQNDLVARLDLDPRRISVVYNPVVDEDLEELAATPVNHPWFAEERPVVLAAGRLVPQKGFDTLLEAFARLAGKRGPRLLILGEGPEREPLERLSVDLGCRDDVDFAGYDKNPFKYMARCAVFVLSSRNEGLPGVLIQAMACGAACVATDCPAGPAEIIEDGRDGILVPVGDPQGLAAAIERLLSDPDLATRLGNAALSSVRRFEVARVTDLYLQALFPGGAAPVAS